MLHVRSAMALKREFQFAKCAPKPRHNAKITKASEVKIHTPYTGAVPDTNFDQIVAPKMVMAFDIEAHGWPEDESNEGHIGRFGFYTMTDDETIAFARVVQIGWVLGENRKYAPTISKSYII